MAGYAEFIIGRAYARPAHHDVAGLHWCARLRFAHPTDCELMCFARKRNLGARLRQNNTTGKSPKTCPALRAKIFRLTCRPNQRHNSARLTADEGRWPSSRTRGEMRWTRELRLTCVARACGEVVWSGRRGAGVKFARGTPLTGDGGKRAVHRGEHEVSRKAIAQGRPECSRCPVCSCALLFAQIARETAGAASTRSSLRPLISKRANEDANLGRSAPREGEGMSTRHCERSEAIHSAAWGQMDCFASLAMTLSSQQAHQTTIRGKPPCSRFITSTTPARSEFCGCWRS